MSAARKALVAALCALAVTVVAPAPRVGLAQEATPAETPRAHYRRPGANRANQPDARDLGRHEQTIRQGRNKIRQVLLDPKASPQVKQTATELNDMLARRRALIAQLKNRHKDFVSQHKPDLDELTELSRRAHEVNTRLDAARDETIKASSAELAELKQISINAATLAERLRTSYEQEQRARRGAQ